MNRSRGGPGVPSASCKPSPMKTFPADIQFCFPWRPYQQRVLTELADHLSDDRLHVIAPPGSGKTVLGLEAVRRLNRPTLILAPTLAIRDQWVDRFVALFLPPPHERPDWISTDLSRPAWMTVGTYQGLFSLYSGEPEEAPPEIEAESDSESAPGLEDDGNEDEDAPPSSAKAGGTVPEAFLPLKRMEVRTIVVDEAHHLKNAWWRSLTALIDSLDHPTVAALTATPPYDVSFAEWERYKALCGPVDSEISVPELLLEKNLCPHQDYVYLSSPTETERRPIQAFREAVDAFVKDLVLDFDFIDGVESHPWMAFPEEHLEEIFSETEAFSSMLVFLHHVDRWISSEALQTLGVERKAIPEITLEWLEILLTHAIYRDKGHFEPVSKRMKEIRRNLSRMGAVERRKVALRSTRKIQKSLTSSVGKLESIVEVVRVESESLKNELRMVVLTDFIYAGDMPDYIDDLKPVNRIGVVPVFERLRREHLWEIRPGILCGSLVVIPEEAVSDFQMIAAEIGVDLDRLRFEPLSHDPGFQIVHTLGTAGEQKVRMMTELFRLGGVNLLVGTKSLLGEGWDAPFLNSLILATWVGSWVLSNQMRGRAIRTEAGNPEKTANIWHLVCVAPGLEDVGGDLANLNRRFNAFVGVCPDGDRIENGLDRLGLPSSLAEDAALRASNAEMIRRARDRAGLRRAWETALKRGAIGVQMIEEVKAPPASVPGRIIVRNGAGLLVKQAIALVLLGLTFSAIAFGFGDPVLSAIAVLLFGGACLFFLPRTIRMVGWWARFGADAASLRQIGKGVLKTLIHIGHIRSNSEAMEVCARKDRDGGVACRLEGGSAFEKSLFLDALQEVIEPVENPRYLICLRKKRSGRDVKEYYPVPWAIARKKDFALYFQKMWRKHLCPAELIYTRTVSGRKELLKARLQSLRGGMQPASDRTRIWK